MKKRHAAIIIIAIVLTAFQLFGIFYLITINAINNTPQPKQDFISCDCATCTALSDVIANAKQPETGADVLCYDYARGFVYSGFVREDGSIQLRINDEGNLVIVRTVEAAEAKLARLEGGAE